MSIRMYDTIVPGTAKGAASTSGDAVAGYVGGSWPDYNQMVALFPHDYHLSIAINASEDADCLDIERGDAVPDQAPAWVRRQHARGIRRPALYTSMSVMPVVEGALGGAGIPRTAYRLWVADWTGVAHIPSGFDACQWTDHYAGRNLDASLCLDDFFDGYPQEPPAHAVAPVKKPAKAKKHPIKAAKKILVKAKPAPVHPKTLGSTLAGALSAAVFGVLKSKGVHVDAETTSLITAGAAALVAWLVPSPKS
jgi:hypothetical protein